MKAALLLAILLSGCRVDEQAIKPAALLCDGALAYTSSPTGRHWEDGAVETRLHRIPAADKACAK